MATKKVATKKSGKAAQPAKKAPAKPVKKAAVKTAPPKKAVKTAPAKAKAPAKSAPAKPAKAAPPAKTKPVASKPVAKAPAKPAAKANKVVPAAKKEAAKKPAPAPQKKVSAAPQAKKVAEKAPAKSEPVKKPEVVAPTRETTKEATKPLEKSPAKAKEPARPAKVVIPKTSTDKVIKYEPDFTRSILDNSQKQEENGPTMRYSDAELIEFRELINKKLDIAKKELAYLQGLITRKDESSDLDEGRYMTMEDGSMSMEREQLSQMASRQIQFIDHLEKAIMRIENKTYGICRVTGKLIDKARLRAVPHATLSIEAKQMMNK
ncbi:TraR/DksA family transcriptional regulator [Flavisolibacter sp. BT320]|nr:TraR/DksA family transcriptional regulator [Flavisolibacter longurius]